MMVYPVLCRWHCDIPYFGHVPFRQFRVIGSLPKQKTKNQTNKTNKNQTNKQANKQTNPDLSDELKTKC